MLRVSMQCVKALESGDHYGLDSASTGWPSISIVQIWSISLCFTSDANALISRFVKLHKSMEFTFFPSGSPTKQSHKLERHLYKKCIGRKWIWQAACVVNRGPPLGYPGHRLACVKIQHSGNCPNHDAGVRVPEHRIRTGRKHEHKSHARERPEQDVRRSRSQKDNSITSKRSEHHGVLPKTMPKKSTVVGLQADGRTSDSRVQNPSTDPRAQADRRTSKAKVRADTPIPSSATAIRRPYTHQQHSHNSDARHVSRSPPQMSEPKSPTFPTPPPRMRSGGRSSTVKSKHEVRKVSPYRYDRRLSRITERTEKSS